MTASPIISTGDHVAIVQGKDSARGVVVEAEPYRSAWIVFYLTAKGQRCLVTPFPGLMSLPQWRYPEERDPRLYDSTAWFYYKEYIWPCPIGARRATVSLAPSGELKSGTTRRIPDDPRGMGQARIDHIESLMKNLVGDTVINPGDDQERKLWERWWR